MPHPYLKLHHYAVLGPRQVNIMQNPKEIVNNIENYVSSASIDAIVKDMVIQVLKEKPEDVRQNMLRHLMTSVTSADGEVGLASTNDGAGRVAITHADEAAHKYLMSKGIHQLFGDLLTKLLKEQPDDVAGFLARRLS